MAVCGNKDAKGKGFDNYPQNGNKKGRPRKGISLVNFELAKKGYSPATKDDIDTIYLSMIHLSEEELVAVGKDKTKPMLARILAKSLLDKRGFENAEKMLDRAIGKPNQSVSGPNGEGVFSGIQTVFGGPPSHFTVGAANSTASKVLQGGGEESPEPKKKAPAKKKPAAKKPTEKQQTKAKTPPQSDTNVAQ